MAHPVTAPAPDEQRSPVTFPARRLHTSRFFLLVLVVLFTVGQLHLPRVVVLGVFVVYVVAATLWVRAQYVDGLDGCPSVPPARVAWTTGAVALLALGAGLGARRFEHELPLSSSSLILGGLVATYVLVGYLIARSRSYVDYQGAPVLRLPRGGARIRRWLELVQGQRNSIRSSPRTLVLILTGLLVVAWGSLWLWGWAPSALAMAASGVVVFVPWVLSLVSEHAIRSFTDGRWQHRRWWWIPAALVVLAAAVAIGLLKSWVHAAAVVVLAAFVTAVASFTLADIAAVLALLAFGALTPAQDPADRPVGTGVPVDGDRVLVALGDSYISGEGAAVFRQGTDEGGINECRRATTAWPELTGGLRPFRAVVSFACSGADGYNVRHTPELARPGAAPVAEMEPTPAEQYAGIGTQLDQYDRLLEEIGASESFTPELVVLSIGGNDAGFASVGMTCLAPGDCDSEEPEQLWSGGNLDRVQNRIRQVYADVDATFPDTPVAVIPYVNPIGADAPCDQAALGPGDVRFLEKFLPLLNQRVEEAAAEYGFHYVAPMQQALAERDLRLCDPGNNDRPGLNFIGIRSVGGLSEQRFNPAKWTHNSLHPNERGHRALHEAFQAWLNDPDATVRGGPATNATGLAVRLDRQPGDAPVSEESAEEPGRCETFGFDDDRGCKQESIAWALRQTGQFAALVAAPAGLLVGSITWVGAVAFFADRRVRARSGS